MRGESGKERGGGGRERTDEGESEEYIPTYFELERTWVKISTHLRLSFHFNLVLGKPSVDWRGNTCILHGT